MPSKTSDNVNQLDSKTFRVTYATGEELIVKRVPWSDLDEVTALQTQLLECLDETNGFIGDLFSPKNKKFWDALRKLASLMPVVGQEETGIDLDRVAEVEDIIRIFVTRTSDYHEDYGAISPKDGETLLPSEVSRINGLNFFRMLKQAAEAKKTKK